MAQARGKYAKAISDRSGMEFPYNEMVKEWNGHLVHKSEFEAKHPQLELRSRSGDSQGLFDARPARTENEVAAMLGNNPFSITASSQTITVYPSPDSSAASKDMHIYYVKRIQDADSTYTDATDVPYRFVPCMVSGLAFYLAQKFNPQATQTMKLYYEDELARALAEDGSSSSTFITPKTYYPGT